MSGREGHSKAGDGVVEHVNDRLKRSHRGQGRQATRERMLLIASRAYREVDLVRKGLRVGCGIPDAQDYGHAAEVIDAELRLWLRYLREPLCRGRGLQGAWRTDDFEAAAVPRPLRRSRFLG